VSRERSTAPPPFWRVSSWLALALLWLTTLLATACNDSKVHPPLIGGGDMVPGTVLGDPCATPREGCPCDTAGEEVECGDVEHEASGYVTCAMGTRQCEGSLWSACAANGSRTLVNVRRSDGRGLQGYGTSQSCAAANPCDPDCNDITDSSTGLSFPADAGVTVTSSLAWM